MYEPDGSVPGAEFQKPPFPNQPAPPPPGKGMIKVVSIIMIVFGSIGLFVSFLAILLTLMLDSLFRGLDFSILFFFLFFGMAVMACMFVFGIIGIINAGKAAKAQTIINMGIILCALIAIDTITPAIVIGNVFVLFMIITLPIGLVLAILYIEGGNMNKKSLKS